jgi:hypothetical protein
MSDTELKNWVILCKIKTLRDSTYKSIIIQKKIDRFAAYIGG